MFKMDSDLALRYWWATFIGMLVAMDLSLIFHRQLDKIPSYWVGIAEVLWGCLCLVACVLHTRFRRRTRRKGTDA